MRHLLLWLTMCAVAFAHVGSPDVFYEGDAGPYHLLVTVRPPGVIPGVAEIEIRSASSDVRQMRIVPLPLQGPGAKFAPAPDVAERSKQDPQFYTGALWMMAFGSWQVRVTADGARGKGELAVPVPALASRTLAMQKGLGTLLLGLMLFLVVGLISIVGASVREAQLEPGVVPAAADRKRSRAVMAVAAAAMLLSLYLGNKWWNAEADSYRKNVYQPVQMSGSLETGNRLLVHLEDPGWLRFRRLDDIIPDHGHLMHLFLVRAPAMDRIWHLHPDQVETGTFAVNLPAVSAGQYRLFADIVHQTGLPETAVTEMDLPEIAGGPLAGDDSAGAGPPLERASFIRTTVSPLADGYRMVWEPPASPLKTRRADLFRFRVEDPNGKPADDLELYMGMPGHAQFVRDDFQVFAHVHPSGSVPMAALSLAQAHGAFEAANPHALHSAGAAGLPAVVSFPYGLPQPGNYRIFVEVKRAGRVETGVFDARVEN